MPPRDADTQHITEWTQKDGCQQTAATDDDDDDGQGRGRAGWSVMAMMLVMMIPM